MNISTIAVHIARRATGVKRISPHRARVAGPKRNVFQTCLRYTAGVMIGLMIGLCIFPQLLNHHTTKYSHQNEESQAALILKMKGQLLHSDKTLSALLQLEYNRNKPILQDCWLIGYNDREVCKYTQDN